MILLKIGIIVNCVGHDDKCVKNNGELLSKVFPYLDELGFEKEIIMPTNDWMRTQANKHVSTLTLQNPENVKRLLLRNNKGIIVRHCLELLKSTDCKIVLHIDGSGSFYFSDINAIIGIMMESQNHAVLTKRDISGMDKFRTVLEKFERKLVQTKYSHTIIDDGQSGCWCFRFFDDFKPEEHLSAKGYEIELDILVNLLKHNAKVIWHPIKINVKGRGASQFKVGDNIPKLEWLSNAIQIRKEQILPMLDEFISENEAEIRVAELEAEQLGETTNKISTYKEYIIKSESFY